MAMRMDELKENIKDLTMEQLEKLQYFILEIIFGKNNIEYTDEAQTLSGLVCPGCGSDRFVKNGNARGQKGKQRLACRSCGRTFGLMPNSVLAHTKLDDATWKKYTESMVQGFSIRKCAELANVSVKTSFYMRHKILDAIGDHFDIKELDGGESELDETYVAESFKGNHKKSGFKIPRESRKRGKEVKKRGLSGEQVCIGTGIDNEGNIIMEVASKARIKADGLERLFAGQIAPGAIIITDSYRGYESLAYKLGLRHIQIPSGEYKYNGFTLSSVNSLHNRFKGWMKRFNGVATKYLSNYLVWFKWLENYKKTKEIDKFGQIWNDALASRNLDVRIEVFKNREVVWI